MPRALRALAVAAALLAGGALASAAEEPFPLDEPLRADLDRDGVVETVVARETQCFPNDGPTPPPCEKGDLRTLYVNVNDTCATGTRVLTLSREMDFVSLARIVDADNDGLARELAFEVRAGATGRGVQAKVVALQPRRQQLRRRAEDAVLLPAARDDRQATEGSVLQDRLHRARQLRQDAQGPRAAHGRDVLAPDGSGLLSELPARDDVDLRRVALGLPRVSHEAHEDPATGLSRGRGAVARRRCITAG